MSRGKNNASLINGASSATSAQQQQSGSSAQQLRRGNKTLAWYISDKILDETRDSASPLSTSVVRPGGGVPSGNRKNSADSQSSLNSFNNKQSEVLTTQQQQQCSEEEKQRRKRGDRRTRPTRSSTRANERDFSGNNTKENHEEDQHQVGQHQDQTQGGVKMGSAAGNPNGFAANNKDRKEDYWYFDPVSDGFYYEHNGSRGWRKRNPKLHGPTGLPLAAAGLAPLKPSVEVMPEQQKSLLVAPPVSVQVSAGSTTTTLQTSKFFPTATAVQNVPNIKYYDAASDGFFYEMASVDGWRRRQPVGSNGISPPNSSVLSSQGHHQQQQQQQQRIFRPLQQQSMGRCPSNILTSVIGGGGGGQSGNHFSSSPLGANLVQQQQGRKQQQQPFGGQCSGGMQQNPAVNGRQVQSLMTNAELEDMIVHSKSAPKSANHIKYYDAASDGSSSTTISSSLSDDHCSPPPVSQNGNGQQQNGGGPSKYAAMLLGMQQRGGWQGANKSNMVQSQRFVPQYNGAKGVDIQNHQQQTKTQPIGSFEEPYEFYWSDNDKNSMSNMGEKASSVSSNDEIVPPTTTAAGGSNRVGHPSLAAYFNDHLSFNDQLQQQLNKEHLKHMNNGSSSSKQMSGIQLKRPNSLRLACTPQQAASHQYGHRGAMEKEQPAASNTYMPHCFNVDQFIADLPLPDHEKVLRNLSALRTPMVENNSSQANNPRFSNFETLIHQDSPLFTPILLKEEYGWHTEQQQQRYAQPPSSKMFTCNGNRPIQNGNGANGGQNGGNVGQLTNMERDLKDIWKCPAF